MFLPRRDAFPLRCVNSDTFYLLDVALFMPNITSKAEISFACSPCNLEIDVPLEYFNLFSFFCRELEGNIQKNISYHYTRNEWEIPFWACWRNGWSCIVMSWFFKTIFLCCSPSHAVQWWRHPKTEKLALKIHKILSWHSVRGRNEDYTFFIFIKFASFTLWAIRECCWWLHVSVRNVCEFEWWLQITRFVF